MQEKKKGNAEANHVSFLVKKSYFNVSERGRDKSRRGPGRRCPWGSACLAVAAPSSSSALRWPPASLTRAPGEASSSATRARASPSSWSSRGWARGGAPRGASAAPAARAQPLSPSNALSLNAQQQQNVLLMQLQQQQQRLLAKEQEQLAALQQH